MSSESSENSAEDSVDDNDDIVDYVVNTTEETEVYLKALVDVYRTLQHSSNLITDYSILKKLKDTDYIIDKPRQGPMGGGTRTRQKKTRSRRPRKDMEPAIPNSKKQLIPGLETLLGIEAPCRHTRQKWPHSTKEIDTKDRATQKMLSHALDYILSPIINLKTWSEQDAHCQLKQGIDNSNREDVQSLIDTLAAVVQPLQDDPPGPHHIPPPRRNPNPQMSWPEDPVPDKSNLYLQPPPMGLPGPTENEVMFNMDTGMRDQLHLNANIKTLNHLRALDNQEQQRMQMQSQPWPQQQYAPQMQSQPWPQQQYAPQMQSQPWPQQQYAPYMQVQQPWLQAQAQPPAPTQAPQPPAPTQAPQPPAPPHTDPQLLSELQQWLDRNKEESVDPQIDNQRLTKEQVLVNKMMATAVEQMQENNGQAQKLIENRDGNVSATPAPAAPVGQAQKLIVNRDGNVSRFIAGQTAPAAPDTIGPQEAPNETNEAGIKLYPDSVGYTERLAKGMGWGLPYAAL